MRPAARKGDLVTHPLLSGPPELGATPLPAGSPDVKIDNQRAWLAVDDKHNCTCPTPPAHGLETCFMGSMTVLINKRMAVRMGDVLLGTNVPNPIVGGCTSVLIGDIPFGLADPRNREEY